MLKKLIFSGLLFLGATISNAENSTSQVFQKMVKLAPNLEKEYLKLLADKLSKKAKEYKISSNLAVAILMQESGLRNQTTYKIEKTTEKFCDLEGCFIVNKEIKKVFDMTIAQINIHTAKHYGFDLNKLFRDDLDYALDCFFTILKDKMKMCFYLGEQSFSCYHSITDGHRQLYYNLVKRYL